MTSPTRRGPQAQKLGPGELQIGETGSKLDLSCQVTEVKVTWDDDADDDIPVLCGSVIPGAATYTAKLEATIVQDLSEDGVIDYTWKNKGRTVPVTFTPTAGDAKVTGEVRLTPVDLGGEVGKKNDADVEWTFIGEPTFKPLSNPADLS